MNEEPCTATDLEKMVFNATIHPRTFYDGALEVAVDNWTDLDKQFVAWLAREGHLTKNKLPIHNYAGRGKYFINDKQQRYGNWHYVKGFYVDAKYNANDHIKNLLTTLRQLGLRDPHFYLAFSRDVGNER